MLPSKLLAVLLVVVVVGCCWCAAAEGNGTQVSPEGKAVPREQPQVRQKRQEEEAEEAEAEEAPPPAAEGEAEEEAAPEADPPQVEAKGGGGMGQFTPPPIDRFLFAVAMPKGMEDKFKMPSMSLPDWFKIKRRKRSPHAMHHGGMDCFECGMRGGGVGGGYVPVGGGVGGEGRAGSWSSSQSSSSSGSFSDGHEGLARGFGKK